MAKNKSECLINVVSIHMSKLDLLFLAIILKFGILSCIEIMTMNAEQLYAIASKVWKDATEEVRVARVLTILHITLGGYGSADYSDSIANEYNEDWKEQYGYVSGDEVFMLLEGVGL